MQENHATAVEIKISTVVAVCALMHSVNAGQLEEALKRLTGGAADYFAQEFAVIDVAACDFTEQLPDWPALISLFKSYGLNPVAVRHAPVELEADILAQGLSIDVVARAPFQPAEAPPVVAAEPAPAAEQTSVRSEHPEVAFPLPALIVDTPVRAGQRIYARGRDLIVTAVVNSGAELIADGSIHVYASLRGRALAGASGDGSARIFALGMEAELVSIAGTYRTFENGLAPGLAQKPVQVRLVDDRLDVSPLTQFRA
jgi:septum site-determining protein MinC